MPTGTTIDDLLGVARARLDRLEPAAAYRAMVEDGALLVDTRCAELRAAGGRIPDSVHIPLSVLYWRLDPAAGYEPCLPDPAAQVILVCAHGFSSSLAAATLHDLGFPRATDVVGGFEAWVTAGLPVEAGSD